MHPFFIIGLGAFLLNGLASPAYAWKNLYHPKCPGNDPNVSWRDYMMKKLPSHGKLVSGIVDVQFRLAKTLNDPEAIGSLPTNACYTVRYTPGKGFQSSRIWERSKGGPDVKDKLPGNPEQYEVNVHGVLLMFNEAGEVIDRRGRVVGVMVCYGSNECGGY